MFDSYYHKTVQRCSNSSKVHSPGSFLLCSWRTLDYYKQIIFLSSPTPTPPRTRTPEGSIREWRSCIAVGDSSAASRRAWPFLTAAGRALFGGRLSLCLMISEVKIFILAVEWLGSLAEGRRRLRAFKSWRNKDERPGKAPRKTPNVSAFNVGSKLGETRADSALRLGQTNELI